MLGSEQGNFFPTPLLNTLKEMYSCKAKLYTEQTYKFDGHNSQIPTCSYEDASESMKTVLYCSLKKNHCLSPITESG